jgi:hypothetical protein
MTTADANWFNDRQRVKELRTALKANRIDEQGKEDCLDPRVNLNVHLADDHAYQKRSGDTAQNETPDLDLADQISKRDRRK